MAFCKKRLVKLSLNTTISCVKNVILRKHELESLSVPTRIGSKCSINIVGSELSQELGMHGSVWEGTLRRSCPRGKDRTQICTL